MNIIAIGLDATELLRIRDLLDRHGARFTQRVFTDEETAYCTRRRDPVPHFAGRFAAKEAAMKALGTGHARGVIWRDVEIVRLSGRAPEIQFHGAAARRFADLHGRRALVTITHTESIALAQVCLLGD